MMLVDDRIRQSSTYELHEFQVIDEDDDTFVFITRSLDLAINELEKKVRLNPGHYIRIKSITYLMYDLVKAV